MLAEKGSILRPHRVVCSRVVRPVAFS